MTRWAACNARATADGLIRIADELSRKLRSKVGESLRAVNATPPLERVTTGSLEALRRYSAGVRAADVEGNRVRTANRQMMFALVEGRLRDAGRFRRVSLDTYRAQGVPIEPYTESYISLESAIDAGATAGLADSAIARYEIYKRTPNGSRPRVGPDLFVSATTVLAMARIYDARGDSAKALAAYRDYAMRYERADAELQGTVRWYNRKCRRPTLGYRSPAAFEAQMPEQAPQVLSLTRSPSHGASTLSHYGTKA